LVTLELSQGGKALVDEEDYSRVARYKWRRINKGGLRYAVHSFRRGPEETKNIYLHRMLLQLPAGRERLEVDHINGNGLDNRKANLRICSRSENMMNQRPRHGLSSSYKGVWWHKRAEKWYSGIMVGKKNFHIGCFIEEEEAARAYNVAAQEHFGDFARLNIVPGDLTLGQPEKA